MPLQRGSKATELDSSGALVEWPLGKCASCFCNFLKNCSLRFSFFYFSRVILISHRKVMSIRSIHCWVYKFLCPKVRDCLVLIF